jgi:heme A synthase
MVAWRPRYALAGVLVGSIVVVLQAATGVVDDRSQYVNAPFELTHVLVFAIVVLVALTAGAGRYRPEQQPRHRPTLRSS